MRHVLLAATTLAGCIAVAVVLPLVSAPVTAQEQAATPASQDPTVDCVKALPSDDRFAAIRGKLPLAGADISLTMMANDALPTKQEREAIASWFDARDACAKLGESWREQYYPAEIVALTNAAATKVKVIGVDLYQGKISYGADSGEAGPAFRLMSGRCSEGCRAGWTR